MSLKYSFRIFLFLTIVVFAGYLFSYTDFFYVKMVNAISKVKAGNDVNFSEGEFIASIHSVLLFLLITFIVCLIFFKQINNFLDRIFFKKKIKGIYFVAGATTIYFLYFSIISINKYYCLDYHMVDLGIQNQVIWNSSYLRFFQNTCSETSNFLGGHFSPDLLFVTPFYAIFRSPLTLLVFQTFILAIAAVPVYLIAKKILSNETVAVLFSILFLLSVPIHGANLFEFHEEIFAPVFLLFAYYYLEVNNTKALFIFLLLLCFVKENLPLTVLGIGVYMFLAKRERKSGIAVITFSIIYTLFVLKYALPHFANGQLALGNVYKTIELNSGIVHSVSKMALHPIETLKFIFAEKKILYIILNLFFALGLPLFSGKRIFLILPALAIILLSDQSGMSSIYTQNVCSIVPTVFYLSIFGYKYLNERFRNRVLMFESGFFLLALILNFAFIYQFDFAVHKRDYLLVQPNKNQVKLFDTISAIPPDASVMCSNTFGDVLSSRVELYRIPKDIDTVYNKLFRIPDITKADYIVYNSNDVDKGFLQKIEFLKNNGNIFLYYNDENAFIYKNVKMGF